MKITRVCILGGSGFVGHHLIHKLAAKGIECHILTRQPERHRDLRLVPGVQLFKANIFDLPTLSKHLGPCDGVINLVGILNEGRNPQGFQRAHVGLVDTIVNACLEAGVGRLLHMSALNACQQRGTSRYLCTKGEGESHAHSFGKPDINVTSFRPSVIFGPGDSFFNRFAGLLSMLPVPFPLACPDARFSPVYAGDVAAAFAYALMAPSTYDQRYDLCGPRTFTLEELVRYTADSLGLARSIIRLDDTFSELQAKILGRMPGQPFSHDNYLSMQMDSVCQHNGLLDLGIEPTDVDSIVPLYLGTTVKQQRLAQRRRVGAEQNPDFTSSTQATY